MTKMKEGDYAKNGGFAEFQHDLQDIQKAYNTNTGLGVKVGLQDHLPCVSLLNNAKIVFTDAYMKVYLFQKTETLLIYLQEKVKDGDNVLAADKQVTQREKEAEGMLFIVLE